MRIRTDELNQEYVYRIVIMRRFSTHFKRFMAHEV